MSEIVVDEEGGVLQIAGLEAASAGAWTVAALGPQQYLLRRGARPLGGQQDGVAHCPVEVFTDFLFGILRRQWTGAVAVDTGFGLKRLFFAQGELVFAASSLIDDRLGEIIYRDGRITLDQLTESAAQVTRELKFGQVLVRSGLFTSYGLWSALQSQVEEIVRSVFMGDVLYFEVKAGERPVTEIAFKQGTQRLIARCFSYGCMYRAFAERLSGDTLVSLVPGGTQQHAPGTFVGDLLELVREPLLAEEFVERSKLQRPYSLAALMVLRNRGLCELAPTKSVPFPEGDHLRLLSERLAAYQRLVERLAGELRAQQRELPVGDLREMAASLNEDTPPALFLDDRGALAETSQVYMISQCRDSQERAEFFASRVATLSQFVLQIAGDQLGFDAARRLRQEWDASAI